MKSLFAEGGEAEFTFPPRYNLAPTQHAPVLRLEDGRLLARDLTWGFMPKWAKAPIINAQQETIATKPTFKKAFLGRRCLVPADGFYEWQTIEGRKWPMRFVLPGGEGFCFAGIWERYGKAAPQGEAMLPDLVNDEAPAPVVDTFLIITTPANSIVSPVHARMPVILPPERYDEWLDPATPPERAMDALQHPMNDALRYYRVGLLVNNARHESPECLNEVKST